MTIRLSLSVAAVLLAFTLMADAKALIAPPGRPGDQVVQADVVVLGKVTEVEKDEVTATLYPGAPKAEAVAFKVAVLKVEDTLLGGRGLTQFRIGFPADAPAAPGGGPAGGRIRRPGFGPVALTAGQEGCFLLVRHHEADFYVLVPNSKPLEKADKAFDTELAEVKKSAKALEDPVAALKAKDLADRFQAGYVLLQKYSQAKPKKGGRLPPREPAPAEEAKLLAAVMAELPWAAPGDVPASRIGGQPPSRMALWGFLNPTEIGFKQPVFAAVRPGDPPVDVNKVMDEATAKFLKEKGDKLVLKRYAAD